uniref:NADH-ubiquinone oxidoreductase chain 6 n=1 Tax=Pamphilius sp. ZJUH_2016023 TaxID=2491164 RepID=A0A3Q8U9Z2_9HYME|nr:NADH dehydrogenase subunit 6 [Pamphilius sp. ZJUH_2016023]
MLSSNMMFMGFIFMKLKHPLSMSILLLIYTLLICLYIGMMSKTFWFSYILFLIMLGGMMVLFMYMTNMFSNEFFNINFKNLYFYIILMLMIYILMMNLIDYLISNLNLNNKEMEMIYNNNFIMNYENNLLFNKIYNYPTNLVTLLLIIYLFITLIVVVKIVNLNIGPLRTKMN